MPKRFLGKVPTNSARKRQVDQAVANGWTLQEIASHLGCTIKVVQYYVSGRGSHVQRFIACSRCKTIIFTITGRAIHHPHDPTVLCLACLRKKKNPTFGQRLKAYRLAAGLSKAELAPRIGDRANNPQSGWHLTSPACNSSKAHRNSRRSLACPGRSRLPSLRNLFFSLETASASAAAKSAAHRPGAALRVGGAA